MSKYSQQIKSNDVEVINLMSLWYTNFQENSAITSGVTLGK